MAAVDDTFLLRVLPVWLATRNALTVDRGRHSVRYVRKAATS